MYKDKEKQKGVTRERVRRYRERKGVTPTLAGDMMAKLSEELPSYPDILDKLTSPFWRPRLEKICNTFQHSHHPDYINDAWLGDFNLSQVCELLECTA